MDPGVTHSVQPSYAVLFRRRLVYLLMTSVDSVTTTALYH